MRHRELHSNCMLSHVCGRASPGLGNNLCDNRLMGKRRQVHGVLAVAESPSSGRAWMDQPRFTSPVRALHARVVRHRV